MTGIRLTADEDVQLFSTASVLENSIMTATVLPRESAVDMKTSDDLTNQCHPQEAQRKRKSRQLKK